MKILLKFLLLALLSSVMLLASACEKEVNTVPDSGTESLYYENW